MLAAAGVITLLQALPEHGPCASAMAALPYGHAWLCVAVAREVINNGVLKAGTKRDAYICLMRQQAC